MLFFVFFIQSQGCQLDKVGISRNGEIDLSDVEYYCGEGTIDITTNRNKLNVVLLTTVFTPGGSFLCSVTVIPIITSPIYCNCGYTNMVSLL